MMGRYRILFSTRVKGRRNLPGGDGKNEPAQAFRERNYLTLSGGRSNGFNMPVCWHRYGRKTNNRPRYLFLDEPLNSLRYPLPAGILQLAREFQQEDTVLVAVLHDINLAIQYADRLFFLKEGSPWQPRAAGRNRYGRTDP